MQSSKVAARTIRGARIARIQPRPLRIQHQARTYANTPPVGATSTTTTSSAAPRSHTTQALIGGLIGASAVVGVGYGYYHFSGAKTAVDTARAARTYFKSAKAKISDAAPSEPSQALEYLRKTALAYAGFIPGASGYVNAAFKDLESVREKHKDKVDGIVREAYDELKQLSQDGDLSFDTAQKVWQVLQDKFSQIGELAGDAVEDILENHPDVKDKVGGSVKQLRGLQQQLGPKVKEEMDKTWSQVAGIVQKGVGAGTALEVKKLLEEKLEKMKKLGDEAWSKGLEQAQPMLEKNPKVKELVEKNTDVLKQGDLKGLWDKVKKATSEGGNMDDLSKFVDDAKSKAEQGGKSLGINVDKYLQSIPGASEIISKFQQLAKVAQDKGGDAEKIFKSTIDEVKQVLHKKSQEAEKLGKEVKKEGEEKASS